MCIFGIVNNGRGNIAPHTLLSILPQGCAIAPQPADGRCNCFAPKTFPAVEPCGATVDELGAETIV
jgi:hypothetical protein